MSNIRKTWKTLGAVPDPFEPGVVYVTQELTGHEITVEQANEKFRTEWVPLGALPQEYTDDKYGPVALPDRPETRVQRCRLHANGRLENTDVAPKDINNEHVITVNPPLAQDIRTIAKLVSSKLSSLLFDDSTALPEVDVKFVLRHLLEKYSNQHIAIVGKTLRRAESLVTPRGGSGTLTSSTVLGRADYTVRTGRVDFENGSSVSVFAEDQIYSMRGQQFTTFIIAKSVLDSVKRTRLLNNLKRIKSSEPDILDQLLLCTRLGESPSGMVLADD